MKTYEASRRVKRYWLCNTNNVTVIFDGNVSYFEFLCQKHMKCDFRRKGGFLPLAFLTFIFSSMQLFGDDVCLMILQISEDDLGLLSWMKGLQMRDGVIVCRCWFDECSILCKMFIMEIEVTWFVCYGSVSVQLVTGL